MSQSIALQSRRPARPREEHPGSDPSAYGRSRRLKRKASVSACSLLVVPRLPAAFALLVCLSLFLSTAASADSPGEAVPSGVERGVEQGSVTLQPGGADRAPIRPEGRLTIAGATLIERRQLDAALSPEGRQAISEQPVSPLTRTADGRMATAVSPYPTQLSAVDAGDCVGCRLLCDSFVSLPAAGAGPVVGRNRTRLLLPMRSLCD